MFWDRFKRKKDDAPASEVEPELAHPTASSASDEAEASPASTLRDVVESLEEHEASEGPVVFDDSLTVDDFIAGFSDGAVVDVIDGLLYRELMDGPEALSGIERYAVRLLSAIDVAKLRSVVAEHSLSLIRLNTIGLFWFRLPTYEMDANDIAIVMQVESILNRLALVARRLAQAPAGKSRRGKGASSEPLKLASTSEQACSEADWAVVRGVAGGAAAQIKDAPADNSLLELFGTEGRRGGNWDVMTRFASACERLVLPYRLEYRILADAGQGLVAIHVDLPASAWFPRLRWHAHAWEDRTSGMQDEAAAYYVRLATLLAATGFGSGVGVSRVLIDATVREDDGIHFLFDISRPQFLYRTLPLLEKGAGGVSDEQAGLADALEVLAPDQWAIVDDAHGAVVAASAEGAHEAIEDALRELWRPLGEDDRPLPPELQDVLFADVASDLNVFDSVEEKVKERFDRIMEEAEESSLLAIAQLEDLVSELDATLPDDGRSPLYCEAAFGRYALSLLQAPSKKRYVRLPDFAMHARVMLVRLYQEMGDAEAALKRAEECCRLAPTASMPFIMLMDINEGLGRYDEAIEAAKRGLVPCQVPDEADYFYYRLVGDLFSTDRPQEALASLAMVQPGSEWRMDVDFDAVSATPEAGSDDGLPSRTDAEARMHLAGVPIAPSIACKRLMASVAIGLADAGLFSAAAAATSVLGRYAKDDAVVALSSSMRAGML